MIAFDVHLQTLTRAVAGGLGRRASIERRTPGRLDVRTGKRERDTRTISLLAVRGPSVIVEGVEGRVESLSCIIAASDLPAGEAFDEGATLTIEDDLIARNIDRVEPICGGRALRVHTSRSI